MLLLHRALTSQGEGIYMSVASMASTATLWCGQRWSHLTRKDTGLWGIYILKYKVRKAEPGLKLRCSGPKTPGERAGGRGWLQVIFQGPLRSTLADSPPVCEARWGPAGGQAVETCSAPFFPFAPSPYSLSFPDNRLCATDTEALPLAQPLPGRVPGKQYTSRQLRCCLNSRRKVSL